MMTKSQIPNLKSQLVIDVLKYCSFIGICSLSIVASVSAQSPSPTGTTVRDNIREQVAQELNQIKQAISKKAFLGTISAKSDTGITLTSHLNQPKTIIVTTDTTIRLSSGKEGTLADLKTNDYVLVMGNVDGAGVMTAVRLLIVPKPLTENRKTIYGKVTKVSTTSLTIQTEGAKDWIVKLSSSVKYNGKNKSTDIKVGSVVVVLGTSTTDLALTAKFVHLFPASQ